MISERKIGQFVEATIFWSDTLSWYLPGVTEEKHEDISIAGPMAQNFNMGRSEFEAGLICIGHIVSTCYALEHRFLSYMGWDG
jgi:hypothetical protein